MVHPHDEIPQNLLTSKTGYVEIALRLGFGINLVNFFPSFIQFSLLFLFSMAVPKKGVSNWVFRHEVAPL
jgi:hypothetical protein